MPLVDTNDKIIDAAQLTKHVECIGPYYIS